MNTDKLTQLHELLNELARDVNSKYQDSNDCPGQILQIESSMSGFDHPGLNKLFSDFRKGWEIELGMFFESIYDSPADIENVMPGSDFEEVCMNQICRLMNRLYDQPVYFVEWGKIVKK